MAFTAPPVSDARGDLFSQRQSAYLSSVIVRRRRAERRGGEQIEWSQGRGTTGNVRVGGGGSSKGVRGGEGAAVAPFTKHKDCLLPSVLQSREANRRRSRDIFVATLDPERRKGKVEAGKLKEEKTTTERIAPRCLVANVVVVSVVGVTDDLCST